MTELVHVRHEASHSVVTLNRPERHNSLIPQLLEALIEGLETAAGRPDTGCIVLAANGPSFSTGGDVGAFADATDVVAYAERTVDLLHKTMLSMIGLQLPIVAAVHGMVTGGSLGLVLASDIVLVGPDASFTPWYREVGFSPDGGWTAMLPLIVGHQQASDILFTNRTVTAKEAVSLGIASRLVTTGDVLAEAETVAAQVASGVPGSIRRTKRLLRATARSLREALDAERRQFVEQIGTAEAGEGMARFLHR